MTPKGWQRSSFYVAPVVAAVLAAVPFGSTDWPVVAAYLALLVLGSLADWRYRRYTERAAAKPPAAATRAPSDG